MYLVPRGIIALMHNVPIEPDYENTMYFASKNEQNTWMENFVKQGCKFNNQSYSRVNRGVVRVQLPVEQLYDINYMYFENYMYSDTGVKRYYAFVTKVEYVNNMTTDVFFDIDVIQTWFFDFQLAQCLVEREHTETDSIGDNLIPENLETGEYVTGDTSTDGVLFGSNNVSYIVAATFDKSFEKSGGQMYNGLYSGLCLNVFDNIEDLKDFIDEANDKAQTDGIVSISMMPSPFISDTTQYVATTISIDKQRRYSNKRSNGNAPFNNKLQTSPYNTLYVTNLQGQNAEYPYEYFLGSTANAITFKMICDFSPNPTIILYPTLYKRVEDNIDENISLQGFPQIPWSTDLYKAWLAQTAAAVSPLIPATIATTLVEYGGMAAAPAAASTALGPVASSIGPVGAAAAAGAAISPVGATLALGALVAASVAVSTIKRRQLAPRQAHGGTGSNTLVAAQKLNFVFMNKHLQPEFVDCIDDFFQMYGYAVHKVKVPNISSRPFWNYTKTIGCQITGSLPADDHEKICKIFDKGIRFWKTNADIGNYQVNNSPVPTNP